MRDGEIVGWQSEVTLFSGLDIYWMIPSFNMQLYIIPQEEKKHRFCSLKKTATLTGLLLLPSKPDIFQGMSAFWEPNNGVWGGELLF